MNHKHFNSSVYTDFVRRKANTRLYTDDLIKNIPQSERNSIVSRPPMSDIFTSGIFNDFKYMLHVTDSAVEPARDWYIDTFIGPSGTITSPFNDSEPNIAYSDNKLYYTSAHNRLSVVNLLNNVVTPVAGNGTTNDAINDSNPTSSPLPTITATAVDGNKNIYISALGVIYMIPFLTGTYFTQSMTAGRIYRIAGISSNTFGDIIEDILAVNVAIASIYYMNVDSSGNLFLSHTYTNDSSTTVMMPNANGTFFGRNMSGGRLYIVAGTATAEIFNGDDILATSSNLYSSLCVINDSLGNLIISDSFNNRIRMVPRVVGTYFGVSMPTIGYIYTIAGNGTSGLSGDDGSDAVSARLRVPDGLALDSNGNLYFSDKYNHRIRKVTSNGKIYNIAGNSESGIENGGYEGDDGLASQSKLVLPTNISIQDDNTMYVAENERGSLSSRIRILTFIPVS